MPSGRPFRPLRERQRHAVLDEIASSLARIAEALEWQGEALHGVRDIVEEATGHFYDDSSRPRFFRVSEIND